MPCCSSWTLVRLKENRCKMSAHDFEEKCSSVMESILQSAIAETTKLFEAMVDELRAEMSRIKEENDDLRAKCSYFECAANNPSEKRHVAVQCGIPFCNILVKRFHPSVQRHREIALREHDYDACGNGCILVRDEFGLQQEEVTYTHSCADLLYADADADTRQASPCETGSGRPSVTTSESLKELPENGQSSMLLCPVVGRASINREIGSNPQHLADKQSVQNHLPQEAAISKEEPCDVASSQFDRLGCSGPLRNPAQSVNAPQPPSLQPWKHHTSVPLQDARLLVEAMSLPVEKDSSSHQGMAVDPVCGPSAGALQTTDGALAHLQTLPLSFKSPKSVHSFFIKEVAAAKSSQQTVKFTQPSETESHIRVSSAAPATAPQPLQQHASSTLRTTVLTENKMAPSQETVLIQESDKSVERLISSSEAITRSLESPIAPYKEPTVSQNGDNTSENSFIDNPSSKVQNKCSQSCFRFNREAGLKVSPTFHLKPSAVVRLTRLPFLMSNKESVLISRLSMSAGWDNRSAPKQDTGHHENSASGALPCNGRTRASTPSGESPPVYEESAQAVNNTSGPALTGSPNMSQNHMTTVQPAEKKTASEDQEKNSASCTETCRRKGRRFPKDSFKAQLRNCIKPHLEVRSKSNLHAETQTESCTKLQQEQQNTEMKMDMPEIVVAPIKTNADFSPIPTRKSGLCHGASEPAPPKDKDPDDISSSCTARSASAVPWRCSSDQVRASVEDNEKQSDSSSSCRTMTTRGMSTRTNDGGDTQFRSTIVQTDANPEQLSKKANANIVKGLEVDRPGNVAVKKIRSSGVWIPPVVKTTEKDSEHVSGKGTDSPRAPKRCVVHPPSVPLHPIPVKAAPVVSPLQPLSLIGSRLLKNQCGECGQVLGSSAALESHVGLHAVRPFSCRLCGKYFTDTKALKRHDRVHRNGRIHVCQKCGKGFVYRFSLTKHLQMVHGRIKPFVCQICSKGFFTKLDVESHIRIHTGEKPFQCDLCERKFIRRVDLNVHLRWHNGEKRHWCPHCGKGFLDFNNLKRHTYIHTGEKPHPCTHCPKHFTQSSHLKKHVKNVHKIAVGPQFNTKRKAVKRKTNKFKNKL
ncbi:uncharacterized protein isoform X1 [Takifugu rubripes]|nr:uncharacterized protein LOC105417623 isoform X1 [Takifugu rubripes]